MSQTTELFKQKIQAAIDNQRFDDHEDDVRRRGGSCKGNERWVSGNMGAPEVSVTEAGEGFNLTLTATIEAPYAGSYKRKIFDRPVGCGYTEESKAVKGKYKWRLTKSFFGASHEDLGIHGASPSTDHDSTRMAGEGIREDIFARLDNLA
jgi:hypothetical protein